MTVQPIVARDRCRDVSMVGPAGLTLPPMVGVMPADVPTIIATSIGFDSRGRDRFDWDAGPIFDLAADLSGAERTPRVCYLGTATGDNATLIAGVYSALTIRFHPSHVELFSMPNVADFREHFLAQDIIWVGGGSVANLLALWRLHGWDEYLYDCLLYTSDAADEEDSVDLGGRRIIKKKNKTTKIKL